MTIAQQTATGDTMFPGAYESNAPPHRQRPPGIVGVPTTPRDFAAASTSLPAVHSDPTPDATRALTWLGQATSIAWDACLLVAVLLLAVIFVTAFVPVLALALLASAAGLAIRAAVAGLRS
jgi:hypothetical protein